MKPTIRLLANPDWEIDEKAAKFTSPPSDIDPPDSELWFTTEVHDGSISASVTPIHGERTENMGGYEFRECAFLFRGTKDGYYAAGIGGFAHKYFIAKVHAPKWEKLDEQGRVQDLKVEQTHNLQVKFFKDRITLFDNGVQRASAKDHEYSTGICGIRTNRTNARFEKVDITGGPKCFVVMPFRRKLNAVYRVIQQTVEEHGLECLRADQKHDSKPIFEDIEKLIDAAEVVIVDFTDKNPNVCFEAGLATALKKPLIFLSQSKKDVVFNVKHIRTFTYSHPSGTDKKLKRVLKLALKDTLEKLRQQ